MTEKRLILNALGCGCCMLLLGTISVENGYAHNRNSGHVLLVAKTESVKQCNVHFTHRFTLQHLSVVTCVGCFGSKPKHGPHTHLTQ